MRGVRGTGREDKDMVWVLKEEATPRALLFHHTILCGFKEFRNNPIVLLCVWTA